MQIIPVENPLAVHQDFTEYARYRDSLLLTVAASSARIYRDTFSQWETYAAANGLSPLDMHPPDILAFIQGQDTTLTTRKRQKSAFSSFFKHVWLMTGEQQAERVYRIIQAVKLSAEGAGGQERGKQPLSPKQAQQLIDLDKNPRDAALVSLLLTTGLRRAEAAALLWSDVNFDRGVLTVRHGKGDKAREIPVPDGTLERLREWQMAQPSAYVHLFTPLKRNGQPGQDRPLTGTDIYRTWVKYAQALDLTSKPHDARRTLITEVIRRADTRSAQAIAGHARAETTLGYAQGVGVDELRKKLKLSYG
jgi:integrase